MTIVSQTDRSVTFGLTAAAAQYPVGLQTALVTFRNTATNATLTRNAYLNTHGSDSMSVSPNGSWTVSGPRGGPFSPTSTDYTVRNDGTTPLSWSATTDLTWVRIAPTSGTLQPGTTATVSLTLNGTANGLQRGFYASEIVFRNTTNDSGSQFRGLNLQVNDAPTCSDAFADAPTLSRLSGTIAGSLVGMTGEAGEPGHAGAPAPFNSVWCRWTAPATGQATIDTLGSGFDTTLAIYTGSTLPGLTHVAANNDRSGGNTKSWVRFPVTSGTTYLIAVDGAAGATGSYLLNWSLSIPGSTLVSSILPTARSVSATGVADARPDVSPQPDLLFPAATAFASMINTGSEMATNCGIALPLGLTAKFTYQPTNASNQTSGKPDDLVNILPGATQSFVFGITPVQELDSADVNLQFACENTLPAPTVSGLNTLTLSATSEPVPDMIAIGATPSGDGISAIPGNTGTVFWAAAVVNIGAAAAITATIDDNGLGLGAQVAVCESDPSTAACVNPPTIGPSATFNSTSNGINTFTIRVTGTGDVPFDPANNRLFLRFRTADGVTRGATSVAVRTVSAPADNRKAAAAK